MSPNYTIEHCQHYRFHH